MNLALLVLRLVAGLGCVARGAQKLFGSFGGVGVVLSGRVAGHRGADHDQPQTA